MRIHLLAIGRRVPSWVEAGYRDYARRLPRECRLHLVELPLARRSRPRDVARAVAREGELMQAAIPAGAWTVAVDERGAAWRTREVAGRLSRWMHEGRDDVALLVGGPDGLARGCLQRAQERWSLSPLTLPHGLVRIIIAEQIYRAWSLLRHHPYHRA